MPPGCLIAECRSLCAISQSLHATRSAPTRNPLLAMNLNADGLKTGFTSDGGYGLAGSAIQNNWRLIVVVNGLKSDKERGDEAKKLLEWGYRSFEPRLLFA